MTLKVHHIRLYLPNFKASIYNVLFTLSLACAYFVFIDEEAKKWDLNPLQTTIDTMTYPIQKIPFPTLTVCLSQALKFSSIDRLRLMKQIFNQLKFECEGFDSCLEANPIRERFKPLLEGVKTAVVENMALSQPMKYWEEYGKTFQLLAYFWDVPKVGGAAAAFYKQINDLVKQNRVFEKKTNIDLEKIYNDAYYALLWQPNSYKYHWECNYMCTNRFRKLTLQYTNTQAFLQSGKMGLGQMLADTVPFWMNKTHGQFTSQPLPGPFTSAIEISFHQTVTDIISRVLLPDYLPGDAENISIIEIPGLVSAIYPASRVRFPRNLALHFTKWMHIKNGSDADQANEWMDYKDGWIDYLSGSSNSTHPCSKKAGKESELCNNLGHFVQDKLEFILLTMKYSGPHNDGVGNTFYKDFVQSGRIQRAGYSVKNTSENYGNLVTFCEFQENIGFEEETEASPDSVMSQCDEAYSLPTTNGICVAYNSLSYSQIYKESNYMKEFRKVYEDHSGEIRKISGSGPKYKFMFNLNAQTIENVDSLFIKYPNHFSLSLTSSFNSPNMMLNEFDIISGFKINIQIIASELISDPEIETLPVEKRNCRFSHETSQLNIMNQYTQQNCQFECQLQHAMKFCQCIPYDYPRSDTDGEKFKMCDFYGAYCFRNVLSNMTKIEDCECSPDCNEIRYAKSFYVISLDPRMECGWDSTIYKDIVASHYIGNIHNFAFREMFSRYMIGRDSSDEDKFERNSICLKQLPKDLSFVEIEIDSARITRAIQTFRVTDPQKIAFVGGTIGLFTGANLLTLFSIVQGIRKMLMNKSRILNK